MSEYVHTLLLVRHGFCFKDRFMSLGERIEPKLQVQTRHLVVSKGRAALFISIYASDLA